MHETVSFSAPREQLHKQNGFICLSPTVLQPRAALFADLSLRQGTTKLGRCSSVLVTQEEPLKHERVPSYCC